MKMMQAFYVCRETATVFLLDFYLIGPDIGFGGFRSWDANSAEVCAETLPGCVNFRSGILSKRIELKEGAIKPDSLECHIRLLYDWG